MKITKQQLKRIIQEEIRNVLLEGDLIKGPWGTPPIVPDDAPLPAEEDEFEDTEALIEFIIELILPGGKLSPVLFQIIERYFPGAEQWREQWARKLASMIADELRENKELLLEVIEVLGEGGKDVATGVEKAFLLILENLFG